MSTSYIFKRLIYVLINLWVIMTIIFFLFRALPGDPADILISPFASDALREARTQALGLDDPIMLQYLLYLRDIFTGDLGSSFFLNRPVTDIVSPAFLNTLILVLAVFLLSYTLGTAGGVFMAWTRGSFRERALNAVALFVRGAPSFWIGMMLILLFSVQLGWFPSGGMRQSAFGETGISLYLSLDFLKHLVLPVTSASLVALGLPLLLMRNTMLEVVDADYMKLLEAKGLPPRIIRYRHALRNALMPILAESAQFIGWAVGGIVVIEVVFSWPGLGREIVRALTSRDYPVAQGAFLFIAVLVMLLYFVSDIVATYIDPRTRRS